MNTNTQKVVKFDKEKNLKLWEAVEKTDPRFTRKVEYGRRRFTTIDAYYQIKRATELFGPYGKNWGIKDVDVSFIETKNGMMAFYKAVFFYPEGEFPIINSIFIKDDEWAKKIETDTITKGLSRLGFNADVFMGLFDDNRYIENLRKEFGEKNDNTNTVSENNKSKDLEKTLANLNLKLDKNGKIVGGKTYGKQETLKKLGFKWDSQNKCWFLPNWVAPQETQQANKPEPTKKSPINEDDIPF